MEIAILSPSDRNPDEPVSTLKILKSPKTEPTNCANIHFMQRDFYLTDRGLFACLEKDWLDFALAGTDQAFEFPPFARDLLVTAYHRDFAGLMDGIAPKSMLEIGSSLGRTYFELCRKFPTLKTATLAEPSQLLHGAFQKIFFADQNESFEIIKGLRQTALVKLDLAKIRAACAQVQVRSLNTTFQELSLDERFDLVVCSNVIDQCKEPLRLVQMLKDAVNPGGTLALSCTYQWQSKYIGNAVQYLTDIKYLFDQEWQLLNERNLPFQNRVNERYWMTFLSHAVVYRRRH